MRSLGSLLRAGYVPHKGQEFYQAYSEIPSLRFVDIEKRKRRDTEYLFEPGSHDNLDHYFLWPYFPGNPIQSVQLIKPIPFFATRKKYPLKEGALRYKDIICYTEETIYLFPTFFRPFY
ncbi:hypothetical protein [Marivirga arenosa]|uniref:Uncharacterized protein n=1 Tax=Marivirga arenosa TaxID=3059076 RepID=A0AA49GGG7_9BACT|nr:MULTISPECIES: hypothetical protein [unclassified Marivirga]WKK80553.2 hypothetical protein QYS47_26060 [Marivirga sp. BKB1-2]WKK84464.1 hypothetical protein QYS48_20200 [Marivirga sp. ABR2-2]